MIERIAEMLEDTIEQTHTIEEALKKSQAQQYCITFTDQVIVLSDGEQTERLEKTMGGWKKQ